MAEAELEAAAEAFAALRSRAEAEAGGWGCCWFLLEATPSVVVSLPLWMKKRIWSFQRPYLKARASA